MTRKRERNGLCRCHAPAHACGMRLQSTLANIVCDVCVEDRDRQKHQHNHLITRPQSRAGIGVQPVCTASSCPETAQQQKTAGQHKAWKKSLIPKRTSLGSNFAKTETSWAPGKALRNTGWETHKINWMMETEHKTKKLQALNMLRLKNLNRPCVRSRKLQQLDAAWRLKRTRAFCAKR